MVIDSGHGVSIGGRNPTTLISQLKPMTPIKTIAIATIAAAISLGGCLPSSSGGLKTNRASFISEPDVGAGTNKKIRPTTNRRGIIRDYRQSNDSSNLYTFPMSEW